MSPEIANFARAGESQVGLFHRHGQTRRIGTFLRILHVEHREIFIRRIRNIRDPGDELFSAEKLVPAGAVLIDGEHFIVGKQRKREIIRVGQSCRRRRAGFGRSTRAS